MTKPSDLDPTTHYEIAARCEDCGNDPCDCHAEMAQHPPCLCTAPDCDADHSGMAVTHDPATVEAVAARMAEYLATHYCTLCGVRLGDGPPRAGGTHERHPTRPGMCLAHGTVAELRAAKARIA